MSRPSTARRCPARSSTLALLVGLVGTGLLVWPGLATPFSTPKTIALFRRRCSPRRHASSLRDRAGGLERRSNRRAALGGLDRPRRSPRRSDHPDRTRARGGGRALARRVRVAPARAGLDDPDRGPDRNRRRGDRARAGARGRRLRMVRLPRRPPRRPDASGLDARQPGLRRRLPRSDRLARARAARLASGRRARLAWALAFLAQLAAIAVTRSWASVFAFAAAALVFLVRAHLGRRTLALLVVSACALAIGVRGRSLDRSFAGRAYLWKVSAAHLLDAPWVGNGPGSFAVLWPGWEAELEARSLARVRPPVPRAPGPRARRLPRVAASSSGCPSVMLRTRPSSRSRSGSRFAPRESPLTASIAAAAVSLAVRAGADFPFHRPAELCLFVVLTSLPLRSPR